MSFYTTRIELHNADSYDDYEALHRAMDLNGFSRYITSSDNIKYHLPEAEYFISGNGRSDILALAINAAQSTGKKFSVLVTGDGGMSWRNLAKVN